MFFAREQLVLTYLRLSLPQQFPGVLSYESGSLAFDKVIFKNLKIKTEGADGFIPTLHLSCHMSSWKKLQITYQVEDATIDIKQYDPSSFSMKKNYYFFDLELQPLLQNTKITLPNTDAPFFVHMPQAGKATISCPEKGILHSSFSDDHYTFQFEQVPLKYCYEVLSFSKQKVLPCLDIKNGYLNGAIKLLPSKKINGDLTLHQTNLEWNELHFSAPEVHLSLSPHDSIKASIKESGYLQGVDQKVKNLKGSIEFKDNTLSCDLEANQEHQSLTFTGQYKLHDTYSFILVINHPDLQSDLIHFDGALTQEEKVLDVDIKHIGNKTVSCFNKIIENFLGLEKKSFVLKGDVNGQFSLSYSENTWQTLYISELNFTNGYIQYDSHIHLSLDQLRIKGSLFNHPEWFKGIKTLEWGLSEGNLQYPFKKNEQLNFSHLNSIGEIQNGQIKTISSQAFLNEGKVSFVFGGELVNRFYFQGIGKDIVTLLPQNLHSSFLEEYEHQRVNFQAKGNFIAQGFEVKGDLRIGNQLSLDFGFDLLPSKKLEWQEWWHQEFNPLYKEKNRYNKESISFLDYTLTHGWFFSSPFLLDSWVTPFLQDKLKISLKGEAALKGTFDSHGMHSTFGVQDVLWEFPTYQAKIPYIPQGEGHILLPFDQTQPLLVTPIETATFHSLPFDLLYENINTSFLLDPNHIYLKDAKSNVNDLDFHTDICIDFTDTHAVNIDIEGKEVKGSFLATQKFLSHFETPVFGTLPMTGYLSTQKQLSYMKIKVLPKSYTCDLYINGSLEKGSIALDSTHSSIQEICLDFQFDSIEKTLITTHGSGKVIVDSSDEYNLKIPDFSIIHKKTPILNFDLIVEGQFQDLMRFKGNAQPVENSIGVLDFTFDNEKTFIGQIKPNIKSLRVRNWEKTEFFELDPLIHLESFFFDCERFSKMFFPKELLRWFEGYAQKKSQGEVQGHILFDEASTDTHFNFSGKNIHLCDRYIEQLNLTGSALDDYWVIDQLVFGEYSLEAEWSTKQSPWQIEKCTIQHSNNSILSLKGIIDLKLQRFYVSDGTLSLDIENIVEHFPHSFSQINPKGKIQAKCHGEIIIPNNERSEWHYQATLSVDYKDLSIKGVQFDEAYQVECELSSESGLRIQNFATCISTIEDQYIGADFQISDFQLSLTYPNWKLNGMQFSVPSEKLLILLRRLVKETETSVDDALIEAVHQSKKEGVFNGKLDIYSNYEGLKIYLSLGDGTYYFAGMKHTLNNIQLAWEPLGLQLKANYCFPGKQEPIRLRTFVHNSHIGELLIGQSSEQGLSLLWEWLGNESITIRHISGHLGGIKISMLREEDSYLLGTSCLKGHMQIDVSKLLEYVHPSTAQKIQRMGFGDGFQVRGKWLVSNDNPQDWTFKGTIESKECRAFTYLLSSCHAEIEIAPHIVKINNIEFSDLAGLLQVPECVIAYQQKQWKVEIPNIHVEQLRPSLLRKEKNDEPNLKPLVIKTINVHNVQGVLGDESSFIGEGSLSFSNRTKSGYHSIFTLPTDILTRLGLDLGLFVPVKGEILFSIQDGRFCLSEFKDMYSHEKGSQFYLENSSDISFMDFDGFLNVQLKIRQYNILLKLAELFTIYVGGTVENPVYTVQKQYHETHRQSKKA